MRVALAGPVQIPALRPWLDLAAHDSPPPGRGGTPVTQLACGLLEGGHHVTIATLDEHVRREASFEGPRLRLRVGPYRRRHRARDAFRPERRYIQGALERVDVDLVHAHWTYEYALGALHTQHPVLVTVRDWAPTILRYQPTPYRAVRLGMNVRTLMLGSHFTAASPYMQKRLGRWLRSEVALIPNALDDRTFHQRRRPFLAHDPTLIAVNNGFSKRKNIGTLLQAFGKVRRARRDATLILIGKGFGDGESAHRWALERGLADGVAFRGPVPHDDLWDHFQRADLFVHPALEESFGMVLVEAMSQGLPVIGGHSAGAVPWVLEEGTAGLLTNVRSADALASAIRGLLDDPQRLRHLSTRGYEHAHQHFRLSAVLNAYVELYKHIVRSDSG